MVDQGGDIVLPLPERRDGHHDDVQAVEEVLPEGPLLHPLLQVPVRRTDHPDIGAERLVPAETLELMLLEEAEEFDLDRLRQLADLVKEKGPSVRLLEAARSAGPSPR